MDEFVNGLSDILNDQLKGYFSNSNLSTKVNKNPDDVFYYQWMSLILIANPNFRIILKTHFNNSSVRALANEALQFAEIGPTQPLSDYMKELANLLGGAIKRSLEGSSINCGLSLPLVTYGFDEVFAERLEGSDSFHFNCGIEGTNITVQVYIEYLDVKFKEVISEVKFAVSKETSGGFEFL